MITTFRLIFILVTALLCSSFTSVYANSREATGEDLSSVWYSLHVPLPEQLVKAIETARDKSQPDEYFQLSLGLASVLAASGEKDASKNVLNELKGFINEVELENKVLKIQIVEALIRRDEGDFEVFNNLIKAVDSTIARPDQPLEAILAASLGDIHFRNGVLLKAEEAYQGALGHYKALNMPTNIATVYVKLAGTSAAQGNYELANQRLAIAEDIADDLRTKELKAFALFNKARILRLQDRVQEGIGILKLVLDQIKPEDKALNGDIHLYAGMFHWRLGQSDKAQEMIAKALEFANAQDNYPLKSKLHQVSAQIHQLSGDFQAALSKHLTMLAEAEKKNDLKLSALLLGHIASVYLDLNLLEEARKSAERGYELAQNVAGDQLSILYRCAWTLARYHLKKDERVKAIEYYKEALGYAKRQNRYTAVVTGLLALGGVHEELDRLDEALAYFNEAYGYLDKIEAIGTQVQIHAGMAAIQIRQGKFEQAKENLEKAYVQANVSNQEYLLSFTLDQLHRRFAQMKDWESAYRYLEEYFELKKESFGKVNEEAIAKQISSYERAAKQNEIKLLNKENALQSATIAQQKSRNYLILISGIAIVIIFSLALMRYFSRRETQQIKKHAEVVRLNAEKISLLTEAFKNAGDAMWIANRQFQIVEVNQAHQALTGFEEKDVLGKKVIISKDHLKYVPFNQSAKAQAEDNPSPFESLDSWQGEVAIFDQKGSEFPIEFAFEPIHDDNGQISHYLGIFRDITERKRFQDELQHLATHDDLTGIANRTLFQELLDRACRNHSPLKNPAILFIDLDNFKIVNDTIGHDSGDELIVAVVERFKSVLDPEHTLARIGGDEFCLLIESRYPQEEAAHAAQRLLDSLNEPFNLYKREQTISASIGIALYPVDGANCVDLMRSADIAMYSVKSSAKNGFQFFKSEMNQKIVAELQMEKRIQDALGRDVFKLYYQPKVDLKTKAILGAEALVRWIEKDGKMVYPDQFIPLAERTGLITEIDRIVIEQACQQISRWQESNLNPGKVSINLSGGRFDNPAELIPLLLENVKKNGISPELLEIEITEGMLLEDINKAIETMLALKKEGFTIAVDDFGTGYSSLSYIQRFPIDVLKIDRSFIQNIHDSERDRGIASAIITMAHNLDLMVVAEGVENEEQERILAGFNCEAYQGYYFSRPVSFTEFEELMAKQQKQDALS